LCRFSAGEKPGKYNTFNARSETLASSAMFSGPWRLGQRCIIPALGFYEWHALITYPDDRMITYLVNPRVNSPRNNDDTLLDPLKIDAD
jgi:putative SOS response-associated peptidase YedK